MINILISSVGSTGAINVIKTYKKMGLDNLRIIGVDCNEEVVGKYFVDKFYKIPHGDEEAYLSSILKICDDENINIFIPIFGNETLKISKSIDEFHKRNILVPISNYEVLKICIDKQQTNSFFEKSNITYPTTYKKNEINESLLPLFAKPKISLYGGSRGAKKIESLQELKGLKFDDYVLQEFIDGVEYSIDTFSDMNGQVIGIVPRKRIEIKNGLATKTITEKNQVIMENTKRLLELIKIRGPANIQCFKKKNEMFFFEINPRFGGSYILSIEAGLNAPKYILDIYNGKELENQIGKFKDSLMMLRYYMEVYCQK